VRIPTMPTIEPANTQQVIQMGSHVEKVQQTIQQQQGVLTQQLESENVEADDKKRSQVQEAEDSYQADGAKADERGKQGRLRSRAKKKATTEIEVEEEIVEEPPSAIAEKYHGGRINLRA
jgi:hypothetical protein